jgi:hypothetical protein
MPSIASPFFGLNFKRNSVVRWAERFTRLVNVSGSVYLHSVAKPAPIRLLINVLSVSLSVDVQTNEEKDDKSKENHLD